MGEFVSVLRPVKHLMIYKTYPAREYFDEAGCAFTLAQNVGSLYAESVRELKIWLKNTLRADDMVLFLGAGDIYYIAKYLLKELN
jgi:UDP-N-acetylmuramate-alanine ligase